MAAGASAAEAYQREITQLKELSKEALESRTQLIESRTQLKELSKEEIESREDGGGGA